MKRVFLALLGLFVIAGLCMAQVRQGNFSQRGMASQEMQTDGLSAAHPSLPIGSKARVTNVSNGKEIEVTITGRIVAGRGELKTNIAQRIHLLNRALAKGLFPHQVRPALVF